MNYIDQLPNEIVIFEILPRLLLKDLGRLCVTNQRLNKIRQFERFWKQRVICEFSICEIPKDFRRNSWYRLYIYLSDFTTIPIYLRNRIVGQLPIYHNLNSRTIQECKRFFSNHIAALLFFDQKDRYVTDLQNNQYRTSLENTREISKGTLKTWEDYYLELLGT